MSPTSPMVRAVLALAERDGWSGEDAMTALAYQALVRCEALYDQVLQFHSAWPSHPMTLPAGSGLDIG